MSSAGIACSGRIRAELYLSKGRAVSATGTTKKDGSKTEREPQDFYSTPAWCTELILPHLPPGGELLDPCCGKGAILSVVSPHYEAFGFEIDHDRAALCKRNGLLVLERDAFVEPWSDPHVILTNPPFSLAEEFARKSLEKIHPSGTVAMLLRLSMLAGKKRAALWREHPADVYVLSQRPSFTRGGSDSCEYAWFVWGPGRGNRWFRLEKP